MKLSELIRRARRERRLSQAELARRARLSQAALSYYERERTLPSEEVLRRLETALELPRGELADRAAAKQGIEQETTATTRILADQRTRLLESLEGLPESHALLDKPAGELSGDLVVAMDLRSHLLFAVLDGIGAGPPAAFSSLLAASAVVGMISVQQAGLVWPHELVRAIDTLSRTLKTEDRLVEVFVGLFDRRYRELAYCRTSFPVPYLRMQERLTRLTGTEEELGFGSSGKVKLGAGALLLVATDGLAHLATKASRTYWETPELKSAVKHARTPRDLVNRLESRAATEYGGQGARDDMLALVLSL